MQAKRWIMKSQKSPIGGQSESGEGVRWGMAHMRTAVTAFFVAILAVCVSSHPARADASCSAGALSSPSALVKERLPAGISHQECGLFVQDVGFGNDLRSGKEQAAFLERVNNALSLPFIKGVSVRMNWRTFAPGSPGDALKPAAYNFAAFDAAIAAARSSGKTVSLNIAMASYAPDYVMSECPSFTFVHPLAHVGQRRAPTPWTDCYHKYFDAAVTALAHHYDGNPTVRYISINGPSTLFGLETNWPMRPHSLRTSDGSEASFTVEAFVAEWKRSIDTFNAKVRHTQLALALNSEVPLAANARDALAAVRDIRDYAIRTYAASTALPDKRLLIRLVGLNDQTPRRFSGPNDCSGRNDTPYVALAWDRRNQVKIAYEWGRISRRSTRGPVSADTYVRTLINGISWGGIEVDVKYPDVWDERSNSPYAPYTKAIEANAAAFNKCGN